MTWQAKATMNELVTFLATIPGVQAVRKGEPTSYTAQITASVSLGAAPPKDRTTGLIRRELEFWVTFGYRTDANVALAEDTLADILDALEALFYGERKDATPLGGTVDSMELDTSPASAAEYRPVAGQEYRLYPVIIRVVQQHTVS